MSKADDIRATIAAMPGATFEELLGALEKAGHPKARAAAFIRLARPDAAPSAAPGGPRRVGGGGSGTGGKAGGPNHAPNKSYAPPQGIYVPTGEGRKRRDFRVGRSTGKAAAGIVVHDLHLGDKTVSCEFSRVNEVVNWTIGVCSEELYKEFADELARHSDAELDKLLTKANGT